MSHRGGPYHLYEGLLRVKSVGGEDWVNLHRTPVGRADWCGRDESFACIGATPGRALVDDTSPAGASGAAVSNAAAESVRFAA